MHCSTPYLSLHLTIVQSLLHLHLNWVSWLHHSWLVVPSTVVTLMSWRHDHLWLSSFGSKLISLSSQDCSSFQPKAECGLHCGYSACLCDGDLIWHRLQPGAHWGGQWLVPDQVVAGCHSLHTGVWLHTSTDIQSVLYTQEYQSGSKQKQN